MEADLISDVNHNLVMENLAIRYKMKKTKDKTQIMKNVISKLKKGNL